MNRYLLTVKRTCYIFSPNPGYMYRLLTHGLLTDIVRMYDLRGVGDLLCIRVWIDLTAPSITYWCLLTYMHFIMGLTTASFIPFMVRSAATTMMYGHLILTRIVGTLIWIVLTLGQYDLDVRRHCDFTFAWSFIFVIISIVMVNLCVIWNKKLMEISKYYPFGHFCSITTSFFHFPWFDCIKATCWPTRKTKNHNRINNVV